jgi:hypothetical protein
MRRLAGQDQTLALAAAQIAKDGDVRRELIIVYKVHRFYIKMALS